jgi:hypothetical protein
MQLVKTCREKQLPITMNWLSLPEPVTGADGATTARPPAQKRRRTPGGLTFSEEKARPAASKTPKAGKGHRPGDRLDKATGGENGKPVSSRRERNPGGDETQGRIDPGHWEYRWFATG